MVDMIPIAKPLIDEQEKEKVLEVMESGMLASGKYVTEFEKEFASCIGAEHGIALSSGTTALQIALKAAGLGQGDKVLTTPFTFIASSNSILYNNGKPLFADIDRESYNIDPAIIKKQLERDPSIKALLVVHLYGLTCDMDPIMELVDEYDLILIEDCAQAHGAKYKGKNAGTFGDAAVFSFYPTKNMTTSEGGMILTDNDRITEKSRMLLNHGSTERYYHEILGYNFRMTNIAAAIGLAQLEKLPEFNRVRQENAAYFSEELKGLDWLETPVFSDEYEHVFHQYTLKVENRDEFTTYLGENGIGYGIHYPLPVYRQPLYRRIGYQDLKLPVTEEVSAKVISIPVHPALTEAELEKIVEVIRDFK